MATTTSQYNLIKPELSDAADITAFGSNWDVIDAELKKLSESGGIPIVTAESEDGIAYQATVGGVTELYNGLIITIIPSITSASTNVTLNVNGLGEKRIMLPMSFNNQAMSAPRDETYFGANRPITLQYDAYYATYGVWKTLGKQKTAASDLYGLVPIESGGTNADNPADARKNLGIEDYVREEINKIVNYEEVEF